VSDDYISIDVVSGYACTHPASIAHSHCTLHTYCTLTLSDSVDLYLYIISLSCLIK